MDELPLTELDREQALIRYKEIQEIQSTMGWRWFTAEVNSEMEVLADQLKVCAPEELGRIQGRYDAFRMILDFEDVVDSILADLEREDEEDASL